METLLRVSKLTKAYSATTGARDISFDLNAGQVIGFIGPNGAGKTTTIKMIMGLINSQKGDIFLKGQKIDSIRHFHKVYNKIGFCPSSPAVYDELSSLEMYKFKASMMGDNKLVDEAVNYSKRLDLNINKRIKDLSMGNRQKASFILSIIGNPELIIMDEPTTGMDPLIRIRSLEIINELKKRGVGILLSSHNLVEIEALCDQIIIIKESQIIYNGSIDEIKKRIDKKVKFEANNDEMYKKVMKDIKVTSVNQINKLVEVITPDTVKLVKALIDNDITNFTVERPSLEEAFIDYYKPNE